MQIELESGSYVLAVSGGVDSLVLLDILAKLAVSGQQLAVSKSQKANSGYPLSANGYQLIVAHFDHGIRSNSADDRLLVQGLAKKYGLTFVFEEGHLGAKASEDQARQARYAFLKKVARKADAKAIITAHHEDDMLETAIINLIRGTGRRGLTSIFGSRDIVRPLLSYTKKDILAYAKKHKLKWSEDITNQDTAYLRNYVRHTVLPKIGSQNKQKLLNIIRKLYTTNQKIDSELNRLLNTKITGLTMEREMFNMLTHGVAKELMAAWLRRNGITGYDRKTLERLIVAAKTYRPGKQADVNGQVKLKVGKEKVELTND